MAQFNIYPHKLEEEYYYFVFFVYSDVIYVKRFWSGTLSRENSLYRLKTSLSEYEKAVSILEHGLGMYPRFDIKRITFVIRELY